MDIEEFEKTQQPRAKRSRLDPFRDDIFRLKAKGYANWQVSAWLKENGLKVSSEMVRKFIKSRESSTVPASMQSAKPASASSAPIGLPASNVMPEGDESSQADDMAGLDKKQKREKLADKFIKSENTNPLLKRLKENSK